MRHVCRTQAPGPDRPPGGLPSGVWYTPAAAPLPARAGEEARGPLDSGSLPPAGKASQPKPRAEFLGSWKVRCRARFVPIAAHFLATTSLVTAPFPCGSTKPATAFESLSTARALRTQPCQRAAKGLSSIAWTRHHTLARGLKATNRLLLPAPATKQEPPTEEPAPDLVRGKPGGGLRLPIKLNYV